MPKIERQFTIGAKLPAKDYVNGDATEAGLNEVLSKVNLAPYVFETVAAAEAAEYSYPETAIVIETYQLYVYDSGSVLARDGNFILNTGGAGRLVSTTGTPEFSAVKIITGLINHGTTANAFGDSITKGSGSSDLNTTAYIPLLEIENDWSIANYAVGGYQAADIADFIYAHPVSANTNSILAIGVNDQRRYLTDAGKLNIFKKIHLAESAYLAIPDTEKVLAQGSDIAYTGIWLDIPGVYSNDIKYTATLGSKATFDLYGSNLLISTLQSNFATGTFSIKVDGVLYGNYTTVPTGNISTAVLNRQYGPDLIVLEGLTEEEHTIEIEHTGGTNVYFHWAAGTNKILDGIGTSVYVANLSRMTAAGYIAYGGSDENVTTYNDTINDNVSYLASIGLNVTLVNWDNALNFSTDYDVDGLHPNDAGHAKLAELFVSATNRSMSPRERQMALNPIPNIYSTFDGTVVTDESLVVGGDLHVKNTVYAPNTDVPTTTYDILSTDFFVGVSETADNPVTVDLPALSEAWDTTTGTGQVITISDTGSNAGTNNISVVRRTGEDDVIITRGVSETELLIQVDGDSIIVQAISADNWVLIKAPKVPVFAELWEEGEGQKTADTIVLNAGTNVSGTVADSRDFNQVYYQIQEIAATPGFHAEFNFSLDNVPGKLTFIGRYEGQNSHDVVIQAWNYTNLSWDSFSGLASDIPDGSLDLLYALDYADLLTENGTVITDYISGTDAKIRIYHTTAGTATHDMYVDYIAIQERQFTVVTPGTYVPITGLTDGEIKNVTTNPTNGTMTVEKGGVYTFHAGLSFSGDDGEFVKVNLFKNGVKVDKAGFVRRLGDTGDVGSSSFSCILEVVENDVLDVRFTSQITGVYINIENMNMTIKRISQQ
jgi:lysophospholipase L1-like esterase